MIAHRRQVSSSNLQGELHKNEKTDESDARRGPRFHRRRRYLRPGHHQEGRHREEKEGQEEDRNHQEGRHPLKAVSSNILLGSRVAGAARPSGLFMTSPSCSFLTRPTFSLNLFWRSFLVF